MEKISSFLNSCIDVTFSKNVAFLKKCIVMSLFFIGFSGFSLADSCDSHLIEKAESGEQGYRNRNGICEGLYESPVSADFELVSLVEYPLTDYKSGDFITIRLPFFREVVEPFVVSVRALALKPRLYYRMDAKFTDTEAITWPVDQVLSPIELTANELGVFGWHETSSGLSYVPIHVSVINGQQKTPIVASSGAEVIVRAAVPIKKVTYRLLYDDKAEEYRSIDKRFATRSPIKIPITWPDSRPTNLSLEVAAKPVISNTWLIQTFDITLPDSHE
jgi:hypothetical protein